MKYLPFYLLLLTGLGVSCGGQNNPGPRQENSSSKDTGPSHRTDHPDIHTNHQYTDEKGNRLVIQNGYPRGGLKYTDPDGQVYNYVIFWTRMINETTDSLKVAIDFPLDSTEFPSSSGRNLKLLLPSDTMTADRFTVFDYGLDVKSFLDKERHVSSSLQRTIAPGDSSAFLVVLLAAWNPAAGGNGVLRPGLSLRGQDLFYTISSYTPSPQRPPVLSLAGQKEIHCGKINLENLMLKD